MKNNVRVIFLLVCFAIIGFFAACDLPVGLGSKVNTTNPIIKIPDTDPNAPDGTRQPGGFLNGSENQIFLDITQEQGFSIETVFMAVEYFGLDGNKANEKIPGTWDKTSGRWKFNIDTIKLKMDDGQIKAQATAIDSSGRNSTSTDIIFFVKNIPAQIEMTIPGIKGDDFDDETFMSKLREDDPVFVGFDLMGLATDAYGIESTYPQIQIWPIPARPGDNDPAALDAVGLPTSPKYAAWRPMEITNSRDPVTSTRITWPMVELMPDASAPGGVRYKLMGYGDVPVENAVLALKNIGYDGFLSLEWVKRWNPELEEPGIVFAQYKNYMKEIM